MGVGVSGEGAAIFTGVAAPRLVPAAIAAIWLAYRMYVPALAARAPLGATNAATGTGEARISLMIWRIDKSRPPGVSILMMSARAPSSREVSRLS